MTLGQKQRKFTHLIGKLILWVCEQKGWQLSFGDAYRSPEQAQLNAQKGIGVANSLHTQRLAIDLNLFIDGQYQTDSEAYRPLGEYWKSLDSEAAWGGDFSKPDGNHFSLAHNGVR